MENSDHTNYRRRKTVRCLVMHESSRFPQFYEYSNPLYSTMAAFHGFPQPPPKLPPSPPPTGWEAVVRWMEKDDVLLYFTASLGGLL